MRFALGVPGDYARYETLHLLIQLVKLILTSIKSILNINTYATTIDRHISRWANPISMFKLLNCIITNWHIFLLYIKSINSLNTSLPKFYIGFNHSNKYQHVQSCIYTHTVCIINDHPCNPMQKLKWPEVIRLNDLRWY